MVVHEAHCGHDRVTRTGFTLPPETTTKPSKIYETALKTLDITKQGRDPSLKDGKQDEPLPAPAYCLEKGSKGAQGLPRGEEAKSPGRPEFLRYHTQEETAVKRTNSIDVQRVSLTYSAEC